MNNWMMQSNFGRFTAAAGFKEVGAVIEPCLLGVAPNSCSPLAVLPKDAAKGLGSVGRVVLGVRDAKIRPAIIGRVGIFMIDHFGRLFAGHQEPRNTMALKNLTFVLDAPITFFASTASNAADFCAAVGFGLPNKIARFGAVINYITDRFGYKSRSHVESPLSVVRGLVAPTASTPTLSQGVVL